MGPRGILSENRPDNHFKGGFTRPPVLGSKSSKKFPVDFLERCGSRLDLHFFAVADRRFLATQANKSFRLSVLSKSAGSTQARRAMEIPKLTESN